MWVRIELKNRTLEYSHVTSGCAGYYFAFSLCHTHFDLCLDLVHRQNLRNAWQEELPCLVQILIQHVGIPDSLSAFRDRTHPSFKTGVCNPFLMGSALLSTLLGQKPGSRIFLLGTLASLPSDVSLSSPSDRVIEHGSLEVTSPFQELLSG